MRTEQTASPRGTYVCGLVTKLTIVVKVLLYLLCNCRLARFCLVELANDALALGAPEKLQEM